jgi:hypothetical protein
MVSYTNSPDTAYLIFCLKKLETRIRKKERQKVLTDEELQQFTRAVDLLSDIRLNLPPIIYPK